METGIFAAGCFWKPDLQFEKLKGVKRTNKRFWFPKEIFIKSSFQNLSIISLRNETRSHQKVKTD